MGFFIIINFMSLFENINNDLKKAIRAKEEIIVSTLRMLISAIRNKEIAQRKGDRGTLSDEQIVEVIGSEIKKRKDSVEAYQSANREDLAQKEEAEMKILEKYLPEQLSDQELESIVKEVVDSADDKNFGSIMGQVMAKVKGKTDGNKVSAIVKKLLS